MLLDYWSENLCRDFVVLIDNIWEAPGKMRANLDALVPLHLCFKQCQQIAINSNFSDYMLRNPDLVSWGLNEFALVQVEEINQGYEFRVLWEDERYINIKCAELIIDNKSLSSDLMAKYSNIFAP